MLPIQIILSAALLFAIYKIISSPGSVGGRAVSRLLFVVFLTIGLVAVFIPETMNQLARLVGVGRGADFVLYLFVVVFVFDKISSFYTQQKTNQRIDKLARKIALSDVKEK